MFNIALQQTTDNAFSMTLRDHLYLIKEWKMYNTNNYIVHNID